jgi:hypothetical protein
MPIKLLYFLILSLSLVRVSTGFRIATKPLPLGFRAVTFPSRRSFAAHDSVISSERSSQTGIIYNKNVENCDCVARDHGRGMDVFRKYFIQGNIELQLFPENSRLKKGFLSLGRGNGSIIAMKELDESIPGKFVAVLDNAQPNRAFLGHAFHTGSNTELLTFGGIVYFSENGRQTGIRPFHRWVFENDFRNGRPFTETPESTNLFLHGNSLVHVWNPRTLGYSLPSSRDIERGQSGFRPSDLDGYSTVLWEHLE